MGLGARTSVTIARIIAHGNIAHGNIAYWCQQDWLLTHPLGFENLSQRPRYIVQLCWRAVQRRM